jgi:signal transduction histidine kinase
MARYDRDQHQASGSKAPSSCLGFTPRDDGFLEMFPRGLDILEVGETHRPGEGAVSLEPRMFAGDLRSSMEQEAHEVLRRIEATDVPLETEGWGFPLDGLFDPRVRLEDDRSHSLHGVFEGMLALGKPFIDLTIATHFTLLPQVLKTLVPQDDAPAQASRYRDGVKKKVSVWDRLARVDVRVWDGLLAAILFLIHFMTIGAREGGPDRDSDLIPFLVVLSVSAPLFWRRRAPLTSLLIVSAGIVAAGAIEAASSITISLSIAAYSAAAYSPRSRALAGALLVASGCGIASQFLDPANLGILEFLTGAAFIVGIPAMLGLLVHDRRQWRARERERAARDAATAERSRIARELHDVVAHAMGVMVVQAGGARTILKRDPDEVGRALLRIEETGRTGLSEMRRLLESDRGSSNDTLLAPQAGLQRLDELTAQMRSAGLTIDLEIEGVRRPLAPGVDLSAFRIVQEALTNTLKHARSAKARVVVRYEDHALHVEVTDEGGGPTAAGLTDAGAGRGIIGMRERVALLDGEFYAGSSAGGGFVVTARLPLREVT